MTHEEFNKAKDRVLNPHRQSIELDCAPGCIRPGDLIEGVIDGLGIPLKESSSKCFGCWEWSYDEIDKTVWDSIKPVLGERIKKLFNAGVIRYGSW